jgi:hypothetical protein
MYWIFLQSQPIEVLAATFGGFGTIIVAGKLIVESLISPKYAPIDIHFENQCRKAATVEAALAYVRECKLRQAGLPAEWQLMAMTCTDFEFEWLIVSVVWAKYGQRYKAHRLQNSPFKWEIITLENQSPIKS